MTVTVTERLAGTRSGSIDPTGARTLTREFDIVGTDVLQTAIASMDAEVEIGHTYAIGVNSAGFNVRATYYGQKSWTRPEGVNSHWIFTITYSTAPSANSGTTGKDALITTQGDSRGTTKGVYRKYPNTENVDDPDDSDIGGVWIDVAGVPTTVTDIDRRFNTTEKYASFPAIGAYENILLKRNESMYEGGEAGSILYLSYSWNYETTTGLWVVNHQFAVDTATHHAEQVAKTDPQGEVITEKIGDFWHAKHVRWVQPFETASFSVLPDF